MRPPETPALLRWYDRQKRDLPWRKTQDPYRVWVSEIMLQQTRVATALPYYVTFIERFPSVHDLAAAEVDDVLALWSGLGYYRRARQMHAAAVVVAEGSLQEGGTCSPGSPGRFPQTSGALRKLPGIGPYTAAAIASICFDEVIPVMDGNVERVLARRLALREDVKRSAPRARLLAAAAELLDAERPGDSNQALMELGATICTPRLPRCDECPLEDGCLGRSEPEIYPAPRAKRSPVLETRAVAVARHRGAVLLLRRRSDDELMAGLWELPQVEIAEGTAPYEIAAALSLHYGGTWDVADEACRVRHSITHRAITLCVHPTTLRDTGEVAESVAHLAQAAWVVWDEDSDRYATSSMVGKVLRALPE